MLNDTLALDSDDEYRLTGTETRPKEMVAVPIERAGMAGTRDAGVRKGMGTLTNDDRGRK
jgi:hypothetical protein